MEQTQQVLAGVRKMPREKFWTKVWRTVVGVGLLVVLWQLGHLMPGTIRNGGWVLAGVLVAGELVLFPVRLLGAAAVDVVAPAIRAIRKALSGNGG